MGEDGEALRHRGLKSSSLRLETSKLWWGSAPPTYHISDLTTPGFGIRCYTERITSSPLSDPLN